MEQISKCVSYDNLLGFWYASLRLHSFANIIKALGGRGILHLLFGGELTNPVTSLKVTIFSEELPWGGFSSSVNSICADAIIIRTKITIL